MKVAKHAYYYIFLQQAWLGFHLFSFKFRREQFFSSKKYVAACRYMFCPLSESVEIYGTNLDTQTTF